MSTTEAPRDSAVTALSAIGTLIASSELSLSNVRPSWVLLSGAVLGLVLVLFRHGSAGQLIQAQSAATSLPVMALTLDHLRGARPTRRAAATLPGAAA
jgi:hypothetical protein